MAHPDLFPTPTASDGTTGGIISANDTFERNGKGTLRKINQQGTNGSIGLGRYVQFTDGMFPTPRRKEFGDYQYSQGNKEKPILTLSGVVKTLPSSDKAQNKGQLNPDWVEWLMGFPIGWTDTHCQSPQMMEYPMAWENEPEGMPRTIVGVENRVDRIKVLGNGVVPEQFFPFFDAIYKIEQESL